MEAVAITPDGRTLASGSWDRSVCLYDLVQGQLIRKLTSSLGCVKTLTFSPDCELLATAGSDSIVRLWSRLCNWQLVRTLRGHQNMVFTLRFSPDGRLLASGGGDSAGRLWEVAGGQELHCLRGHRGMVLSVAANEQTARLGQRRRFSHLTAPVRPRCGTAAHRPAAIGRAAGNAVARHCVGGHPQNGVYV